MNSILNQNGFQSRINYLNQKVSSKDYTIQYDFHYGIKCRFDLYYNGKLINRITKNGRSAMSYKKILKLLNKLFNKKMEVDKNILMRDVPSFGKPLFALKLDSSMYSYSVQRSIIFGMYSEKEIEDEFISRGKVYSEGFDYYCTWEKFQFTDNLGYSHTSRQITGIIIKNDSKKITKLLNPPLSLKLKK
jgi:hypothetical protein